ncbi:tRNA lysidine(34) synthetase TilS [Paraburkholderia sp.]|uniref:tRNA lysidine(34) synthetase TilS n=1 Tax=Paraburkholderia sp. TaxID=1926495 RepID=UPI0023A5145B|nr:tRNA lysidine(34) synthetase TilS [Paraburkholderia sp.]MDE1183990.1 tRNA lysidine(34) synthetase TilS [Paraburkholderia sp.]
MTASADSPAGSSTGPHAERVVLDALGVALRASSLADSNARIAIAFSGGVDSSVLLDAAVRMIGAGRCIALHVHHGLNAHADQWLAHCAAFAQARGVSFDARRVEVSRDSGAGLEAAARDARYAALDAMCAGHDVQTLWLAQHADDQAETVLLQLLRGAGLAGLAAMAPQRLPNGASVTRMRPLLHVLRAQIEQYALACSLTWIYDESNADTRYARNALRHDVLPALAIHFPGFRDALARTAAHAASAQRLLDELARRDLSDASADLASDESDASGALSQRALLALDDDRALNLLRYWTRAQGLPAASAARMGDALRQLRETGEGAEGCGVGDTSAPNAASATTGHALRVDHAGHALRSYRGRVYWEAGDSAEPPDETAIDARETSELVWRGESVWRLPQWRGTFVFAEASADDVDAIPVATLAAATLRARSREGGERLKTGVNGASRTLKNLFQERGVPAWKRDVPLLYVGETLLFVPLIGVNRAVVSAREASADSAARYVRIDWREDLQLA